MTRRKAIFGLTLLVSALALALAALQPKHPGPLPRGFHGATLAIEMVRSWPELTIVLAMEPPERAKLRVQTQVDFVYTAAYSALFALLAFEVWRGKKWQWAWAAVAMAAGVFDWIENVAILRVAGLEKGFDDTMALAISDAAWWKWELLSVFWLAIGIKWLWRSGWRTPGVGYAAAGIWSITAWWDPVRLEWVFAPLCLALVVQLAYYWPSRARTSAAIKDTTSASAES